MQTEISRFDLVNQVCQAARSDPSNNWEKMREQRITQAKTELNRIEGRLSRKRRDFSKPKTEDLARAEARAQERRARAEAAPVYIGRPGRPRKTLYAWGDSPKH